MSTRALAVVLHDVAPANLECCRRLVDMISGLDATVPITHLLVPVFHRRQPLAHSGELRRWVDGRIVRGDEIALHGFYHLDEGAAPRNAKEWIARRILTAGEGEFSTLTAEEARQRLREGLHELTRCGWRAAGFVPPAWQISDAARAVLGEFPFGYTSTTRYLWRLPSAIPYRVPGLGFSSRSAWRRWTSIRSNRLHVRQLRHEPFLRIALHPIDAAYPETLDAWREIIAFALRDCVAVTKEALLQRVEQQQAKQDLQHA